MWDPNLGLSSNWTQECPLHFMEFFFPFPQLIPVFRETETEAETEAEKKLQLLNLLLEVNGTPRVGFEEELY